MDKKNILRAACIHIWRSAKIFVSFICYWGKAMANYPQELAQDAVCQSHTLSHDWALVPAKPGLQG